MRAGKITGPDIYAILYNYCNTAGKLEELMKIEEEIVAYANKTNMFLSS